MKRWLIFCKKIGCLFCSFLLFGIISSCEVVSEDFPYFIKNLSCVLESKQDVFSNCGVSFVFCNVSDLYTYVQHADGLCEGQQEGSRKNQSDRRKARAGTEGRRHRRPDLHCGLLL